MVHPEVQETRVRITAIDIPFWEIVGLIFKWSIASIPALVALAIVSSIVFGIIGGILGGLLGSFHR